MVDVVDHLTRSRMMSGIRGKNTHPELFVRQFLHKHGFRYRLHSKNLPGCPDVMLPKWKVVIFVHGCFWHRHEGCRLSTTPASNQERWKDKFGKNVTRDQRNIEALLSTGWAVIILWECGLREVESGKRDLFWLLDIIRDMSTTGRALEWPKIVGELV